MGPQSLNDLPVPVATGSGFILRTSSPALWPSLTCADLSARAAELAAALGEYGLDTGRRVGILAEPGPDATVALLAAVRAGGVALLLDSDLSGEALAATLRNEAVVQAVAGDEARLRELLAIRADLPDLDLVLVARPDPSDRPIAALGVEAACRAGAAVRDREGATTTARKPCDPAVEVAGSGAARATWSHAALLLAAERLATAVTLGPRDVVLSRLPVTSADLIPLLTASLLRGVPLVFDAHEPFSFAALAASEATVAVIGAEDLNALHREIVASGASRSFVGRALHRWAVERGRDRDRHPRAARIADVLVLRDLRRAAGPAIRRIQILGGTLAPDAVANLTAVGFTLVVPPESHG